MVWREVPTGPDSPIRIGITDSFEADGIAVIIGLRYSPEHTRIGRVNHDHGYIEWEDTEPAVAVEPTIRMNHDIARGLLEALLRYYGGAPDSHTVRADLMHERGRVDKMLDTLVELASRPQAQEGR